MKIALRIECMYGQIVLVIETSGTEVGLNFVRVLNAIQITQPEPYLAQKNPCQLANYL